MKELQTVLNNILTDKNTNLKPENLKKGVTCLGVTGTYEGSGGGSTVEGVKQFSTVEEMNSSTGNTEGDLAIIYRNEIQNATVDSKFQTATFPDTVVLDTAIADYVDIRYRAVDSSKMFDCMGSLNSSGFSMDCYTETGNIRIEYTSTDGITYTRTDTTGNPVDFGTEIYYEMAERWNDAIGKFIQISGSKFEGLYKYNSTTWELAPTQLTVTAGDVLDKKFYGVNGVENGTLGNLTGLTNEELVKKVELWDRFNDLELSSTDAAGLFEGSNIRTIPLLDTSNVTSMRYMFDSCNNLTEIPSLDTSNVVDMHYMFHSCVNLTKIPLLNTSNVTDMECMFDSCSNLTTVPLLDTHKVTNMKQMFFRCTSLTDESLNNILLICAQSAVTNANQKYLRFDYSKNYLGVSLTSEQATKCQSLSNYQAFLDAGWTTGY